MQRCRINPFTVWERQTVMAGKTQIPGIRVGYCISRLCAGFFQRPVSMAWHGGGEKGRKGAHNKTRRVGMRHGQQEHYSVLGLTADATSTDIKLAFKHLARQYHPDVNKELDAGDLFKSIRLAYEVLSNEATRAEYDKAMRLQELDPNSHWRNWTESELSGGRIYSWAELKHHMHRKNWEQHCETSTNSFSSYKDEDFGDEKMEDREEPAGELFKQVWLMFFCSQFLGAQIALTLCGFHAMLNKRLAPGYKVAHMVAWLIGGQRGMLLIFVLSFASLFCGKASDSLVALVSLALWIGVHLVKFVPLPQGAILVMTYMCFKLQLELS